MKNNTALQRIIGTVYLISQIYLIKSYNAFNAIKLGTNSPAKSLARIAMLFHVVTLSLQTSKNPRLSFLENKRKYRIFSIIVLIGYVGIGAAWSYLWYHVRRAALWDIVWPGLLNLVLGILIWFADPKSRQLVLRNQED